jgi:hypothetical protein
VGTSAFFSIRYYLWHCNFEVAAIIYDEKNWIVVGKKLPIWDVDRFGI